MALMKTAIAAAVLATACTMLMVGCASQERDRINAERPGHGWDSWEPGAGLLTTYQSVSNFFVHVDGIQDAAAAAKTVELRIQSSLRRKGLNIVSEDAAQARVSIQLSGRSFGANYNTTGAGFGTWEGDSGADVSVEMRLRSAKSQTIVRTCKGHAAAPRIRPWSDTGGGMLRAVENSGFFNALGTVIDKLYPKKPEPAVTTHDSGRQRL